MALNITEASYVSHQTNGQAKDIGGMPNPDDHTIGHAKGLLNGVNGTRSEVNHVNGHANGLSRDTKANHVNNGANGFLNGPKETPVAICGMAMRLPGGIRNDNDLYKFLFNKCDARSTIGEDRYSIDGYYSPYGEHGTISTKQGYFLKDVDYSNLDLSMFSFSAAEAEQLGPNHRLVLEVVREAFESSGESEWRGKNIGTYVSLFTEDWQDMAHRDNLEHNTHRILGGTDFALPNRIAYEYDLKGPR